MAEVKELIRKEPNGSISFGDYTLSAKTKLNNFEYNGDIYYIKTFSEITKLEKNEMLIYESIPGSAVHNMVQEADAVSFDVEASEDVNITLEMAPDTEYDVTVGAEETRKVKTGFSGKLSVGVELSSGVAVHVSIKKA